MIASRASIMPASWRLKLQAFYDIDLHSPPALFLAKQLHEIRASFPHRLKPDLSVEVFLETDIRNPPVIGEGQAVDVRIR